LRGGGKFHIFPYFSGIYIPSATASQISGLGHIERLPNKHEKLGSTKTVRAVGCGPQRTNFLGPSEAAEAKFWKKGSSSAGRRTKFWPEGPLGPQGADQSLDGIRRPLHPPAHPRRGFRGPPSAVPSALPASTLRDSREHHRQPSPISNGSPVRHNYARRYGNRPGRTRPVISSQISILIVFLSC